MTAESRLLSKDEWEERLNLEKELEDMNRLEELHWKQRSGENWILKGDANTHFFSPICKWEKKEVHYLLS